MTDAAIHSPIDRAAWGQRVAAFRAAFRRQIAVALSSADPATRAEMIIFDQLLAEVSAPIVAPSPKALPVCRFLDKAVRAGRLGEASHDELVAACGALALGLHWRNKYPPTTANAALIDGFGFCDAIGPDGTQDSDAVTLGLVLLGPQVDYPFHRHPAVELYYVVSGVAQWAVDFGDLTPRRPGEFLIHRSGQPHAMRSGGEALLAISAWRGDIGARSEIVDA